MFWRREDLTSEDSERPQEVKSEEQTMEDLNLNDQPLEYILRESKRHEEKLKDACNYFFSFMRKGPEIKETLDPIDKWDDEEKKKISRKKEGNQCK